MTCVYDYGKSTLSLSLYDVSGLLAVLFGHWLAIYCAVSRSKLNGSFQEGQVFRKLCHHCGAKVSVKQRQFSDRAWAALVNWGEVRSETMGKAICQDCYVELREILIEHTHEIENEIEKAIR